MLTVQIWGDGGGIIFSFWIVHDSFGSQVSGASSRARREAKDLFVDSLLDPLTLIDSFDLKYLPRQFSQPASFCRFYSLRPGEMLSFPERCDSSRCLKVMCLKFQESKRLTNTTELWPVFHAIVIHGSRPSDNKARQLGVWKATERLLYYLDIIPGTLHQHKSTPFWTNALLF